MMHSTELRELRSMIRDELDFRAEVGKEIPSVFFLDRRKSTQMMFELQGPGPDEEK